MPLPRLSQMSPVIRVGEIRVMFRVEHTHTQPFYGSLDFLRDHPGEPAPECTFRHVLDFLEQNEDNTGRCTNNLDGLPPHPE